MTPSGGPEPTPGYPKEFDELPGQRVNIAFRDELYGHQPVYMLGAAGAVCFGCGYVCSDIRSLAHYPCQRDPESAGVRGGPHEGDYEPTDVEWLDESHPAHDDDENGDGGDE